MKTLPGSGAGDTMAGDAEGGGLLLAGAVAQLLMAAAAHASAIINRVLMVLPLSICEPRKALLGRLELRGPD